MTKRRKAWIWFWYNDVTRGLMLMGIHLIPIATFMVWAGVDGEIIKNTLIGVYLVGIVWGIVDNDYSNLRKIGMDEYRNKLNI